MRKRNAFVLVVCLFVKKAPAIQNLATSCEKSHYIERKPIIYMSVWAINTRKTIQKGKIDPSHVSTTFNFSLFTAYSYAILGWQTETS